MQIDIEDTGVGIQLERQLDIFRTQSLGCGGFFGLRLARKMSRHLGGDVFFKSSHDCGSCFSFVFSVEPTECFKSNKCDKESFKANTEKAN